MELGGGWGRGYPRGGGGLLIACWRTGRSAGDLVYESPEVQSYQYAAVEIRACSILYVGFKRQIHTTIFPKKLADTFFFFFFFFLALGIEKKIWAHKVCN